MSGTDRYADWDAAYVLGALSVEDRTAYEDHLSTCAACRAAMAEFAGLPALLAQLPPAEVLAMDFGDEVPVMPEVDGGPAAVVSRGAFAHRRRWLVPLAAAAAALVVGAGGGYVVASRSAAPASVVAEAPARLAFSPVQPSSMTAVVDIARSTHGTQLRVECQYAGVTQGVVPGAGGSGAGGSGGGGRGDYATTAYAIWVVGRDGVATELKEWTARPGVIMHPTAVTPLSRAQIASVEIRRVGDGQTVMRAAVA